MLVVDMRHDSIETAIGLCILAEGYIKENMKNVPNMHDQHSLPGLVLVSFHHAGRPLPEIAWFTICAYHYIRNRFSVLLPLILENRISI